MHWSTTVLAPAAKELLTMVKAGIKGYESSTWYGLAAPSGKPVDIVSKLNAEIVVGLKSPAKFVKYMQSEIDKWRKVIKAAGIQPG